MALRALDIRQLAEFPSVALRLAAGKIGPLDELACRAGHKFRPSIATEQDHPRTGSHYDIS